eukprot:TRINITY_DN16568_c0_g1_i2.p1 TRINITY_DN16568_c0_g1~~TRINITY_DN16568_c0_g1_i2.p1  ORF type:complete len:534 (-),score=44.97 TRINITY_DN16568_c0_g1_i2:47-1648(-)
MRVDMDWLASTSRASTAGFALRGFCVALATFRIRVWGIQLTPFDTCVQEFEASSDLWLDQMFKAPIHYVPLDHQPDWYLRHAIDRVSSVTLEDLVYTSETSLLICHKHHGRFWDVLVLMRDFLDALSPYNASLTENYFRRIVSANHGELPHLPATLRGAMCAPAACGHDEVQPLLPIVFAAWAARVQATSSEGLLHRRSVKRPPALSWLPSFSEVHELGCWSELDLDFAIIGVEHCGTVSLLRNLGKHADIVFSDDELEKFFYGETGARRLIPLRSHVEAFNLRMGQKVAAKAGTFGNEGLRKARGAWNPSWYRYPITRGALATIPGFKAVFIMCEPLGRLERLFIEFQWCPPHHDAPERSRWDGFFKPRADDHVCSQSIRSLVTNRQFKERWAVSPHLNQLRSLFNEGLIVLHQAYFKSALFFPHLADRLLSQMQWPKPRSYPPGTTFPRYNSRGSAATELCSNATLVAALLRKLGPEFEAQESLLGYYWDGSVPEEVKLRRTRCDFQSDRAASEVCLGYQSCAQGEVQLGV